MGSLKMGVKGKKSKKQKQKDTKAKPLPDKIQLTPDTHAVIVDGNLVIYLGEDLKSVTVEKYDEQPKPQNEAQQQDKTYKEQFQSADSQYRSHLIEESKKTKPPEQISTEPTFLDRLKKCTTEALENTGKEFDAEILQDRKVKKKKKRSRVHSFKIEKIKPVSDFPIINGLW